MNLTVKYSTEPCLIRVPTLSLKIQTSMILKKTDKKLLTLKIQEIKIQQKHEVHFIWT